MDSSGTQWRKRQLDADSIICLLVPDESFCTGTTTMTSIVSVAVTKTSIVPVASFITIVPSATPSKYRYRETLDLADLIKLSLQFRR
jgi:hypothetical protein